MRTATELKIKPLGNRYLAELVNPETQTKGGIIIPETNQKPTGECIILDAGDGELDKDGNIVRTVDPNLIGKHCLMAKYVGVEVKWIDGDGDPRIGLILEPNEIFAVVDPME